MSATREALRAILRQLDQGELTDAYRSLQMLHNKVRDQGDRDIEGIVLHLMAVVANEQGRPEEAVAHLQKSLVLKRTWGSTGGRRLAITSSVSCSRSRDATMRRARYFERSLMTARELGDRRAEASALHQLGIVLQEQGRNDEAVRPTSSGP